jgi:hypothetical protein
VALQVRIVNPSNPSDVVILENAANKQYFKSINSSDEGISFEIPKNDPKADKLSPYDEASFTNLWEVWETSTNKKLNFGPITSIDDSSGVYKITGAGRSALLADHFTTLKFFYASIDSIIEELRYENIAVAPSTKVLVTSLDEDNPQEEQIFKTILPDETFYALSKRTKDFIIDEQSAYIPIGKIEPPRTWYAASEYWSGMTEQDTVALDFGDIYKISKIRLLFPWWGGPQRASNRTYEFEIKVATDTPVVYSGVLDRDWGAFTTIFDSWEEFDPLPPGITPGSLEEATYRANSTEGNRVVTGAARPFEFYLGYTTSGYAGTGYNTFHTNQDQAGPIDARYLTVYIKDVHAWYGNSFDTLASYDGWDYQCDPDYRPGDNSNFGRKLGLMTYRKKDGTIVSKSFPTDKLKPESDCHASIIELGAFQEIIEKNSVKPLAKQRIDNNNRQIEYYRVPDASELIKVNKNGIYYQKFEPGTFIRKFNVSWTGVGNNDYHKFFKKDCSNCYPDGFDFAMLDDQNTPLIMTDDSSGTVTVSGRAGETKYLITRGVAMGNLTLNWVDCWKGRMDEFSWGGTYSYTEKIGDYFKVHFRGQSFKWYATVPSWKTGATVKIEFRRKGSASAWEQTDGKWEANMWSAWSTLEASYKIPDGLSAEVVYEITYESGILDPNTIYEIKVTLLDNNFCSVDSIEGYWSASMVEYNEDSTRIAVSNLQAVKQIYDKRFSGGSMYKWNKPGVGISFSFEGDRVIVYSAKGRRHGKLTLMLFKYIEGLGEYDPGNENHVMIPGGDPEDGSLLINLDTNKKGHEIPGFVLFDSNDYFVDGLPWDKYTMSVSYRTGTAEKYTTNKYETGSSSFVSRCSSCNPKTAKQVSIYEYVYLDSIVAHELIGLSAQFQDQTHLEIIKSVAEAIQSEWDANVDGFKLEPRLGRDTEIALREGENTLVSYNIVNDVQKVATRLLSNGSDIDGLPMSAIVEDHKTKKLFKRTITRQHDFRDIADYMQLVGLTRMELKRRNKPEKRITVQHTASSLDLEQGDSFILWTKKSGNIRLRINRKQISESGSGRTYELECVQWPQIT